MLMNNSFITPLTPQLSDATAQISCVGRSGQWPLAMRAWALSAFTCEQVTLQVVPHNVCAGVQFCLFRGVERCLFPASGRPACINLYATSRAGPLLCFDCGDSGSL